MIKPETVKNAKRIGAVASVVVVLGGAAAGAIRASVKADELERRVLQLETLPAVVARIEGKLDALLTFFRVPKEP